jgi:hypothetical protein
MCAAAARREDSDKRASRNSKRSTKRSRTASSDDSIAGPLGFPKLASNTVIMRCVCPLPSDAAVTRCASSSHLFQVEGFGGCVGYEPALVVVLP